MAKGDSPTIERSWLERNLSAIMIGIFGTAISVLMVVMVGSVKDLRTELVRLDTSLSVLQSEVVSTRTTLADEVSLIADEVSLIDDGIIQSIGTVRADLSIANQHLTGIDTHLALIKREFSAPADFSLSSADLSSADLSSELPPDLTIAGSGGSAQRDK